MADGKFTSENQPEEKWTFERAMQFGEDLINWLIEEDADGHDKGNIFFEEYIVIVRGFYPDLTGYLCKKFKPFSELIRKAKKIQELKLQKYGVGDRLNATMTKFVLKNVHGWDDAQSIDHTTQGEKIKQVEFVVITGNDEDTDKAS